MKHQRSESLRKLQRLQKGLPEDDDDLGQIFTIRKCPAAETGKYPVVFNTSLAELVQSFLTDLPKSGG